MPNYIDLTGQKFGRLYVIQRAPDKLQPSGGRKTMWDCICDCGNNATIWSHALLAGMTRSCGCLQKEILTKRNTKHSMAGTRLDRIYHAMVTRCTNPNFYEYKHYGGKGVAICDEWLQCKTVFFDWAYANGYNDTLSLDRIDCQGNYEPNNCRWSNGIVQANNKTNNIFLTFDGQTLTIAEWSRIKRIAYQTLKDRVRRYGWDAASALTTPVRKRIR